MAHVPLNPDEIVPPHMHGFDPLPRNRAQKLVSDFPPQTTSGSICIHPAAFYLDAATLTALLQGERNECTYDGFNFMFGLELDNNEENGYPHLLIHRVKVKKIEQDTVRHCDGFDYLDVPQRVAIENPEKEVEVIDFAIMPVNCNGFTRLVRIKKDGIKYIRFRKNYQDIFDTFQKNKELNPQTSTLFQKKSPINNLITGYYIGWGILDLIRKELDSKIGIKIFLGYGSVSLNISTLNCVHIVAMAADSQNADILDYPLPMVWSTQDQTKSEDYILDYNESNTPITLAAVKDEDVGTLGSSCAFAIRKRVAI